MLQHDYILEVVGKFVESVAVALLGIFKRRDFTHIGEAEKAVAELLDLDPETAMALSPESLVTMMRLSGVGDTVAAYAAYALRKVGRPTSSRATRRSARSGSRRPVPSARRSAWRRARCRPSSPSSRGSSRARRGAGRGAGSSRRGLHQTHRRVKTNVSRLNHFCL